MFTFSLKLRVLTGVKFLVLLTATGCMSPLALPLSAAEPGKDPKPADRSSFRLIRPELRTITGPIGQPGFVEPYERTAVYPKVMGFIEKWTVDIGDRVKKGDVLATIFAPELREEWKTKKAKVKLAAGRIELAKQTVKVSQIEVKAAEARLAEARVVLSQNQAQIDRWDLELKRLRAFDKGVVSTQVVAEVENQFKTSVAARDSAKAALQKVEAELLGKQAAVTQAEAGVTVAGAELEVAESEARRLEALVGYLTLTAPYDGIITVRNVNTSDFVMPAQADLKALRPALPIYVVDRVDIVRVFVDIPEQDANTVQKGTKANVLIRAYRDELITATVSRTSWALDPKQRTLRAEIDLPNPEARILPGMYAYSKVLVERPRRVWALPLNAIDEERSGEKFYWGYKNGRAVRTTAQTGASDDKWIEITRRRSQGSGDDNGWEPIDGTEQVIVGDLSGLTEGKPVKVEAP